MFEIINTLTEKDIKEDFVAIGSYVDGEKIASHSVLIIKYKDQVNQFHYTSIDILFDNVYNDSCFHMDIPVILTPHSGHIDPPVDFGLKR